MYRFDILTPADTDRDDPVPRYTLLLLLLEISGPESVMEPFDLLEELEVCSWPIISVSYPADR